ncbi:MAG: 23S rRNA (pseudouridine(1915)-N(3))-methyltransferase RlmH [Chloroflexi bacterium]|nr:MAG: 23S rRNA (pseudouridine(1915)-N(3))-methyltransferase RlmH [Chloroflexota bacterium]
MVAIGKKHESWVVDGIQRYQKRLKQPFDIEWVLLPHSSFDADKARQEESGRIISRLHDDDYVILLDEKGKMIDSPTLSTRLLDPLERSVSVTIVIGGAYGVDQSVHDRANFIWSLSPLVFPHQLVRLLLVEQIYRAQAIADNSPYHHA